MLLGSLFSQNYPLHEIMVLDDFSTDGTSEAVKSYSAGRPFIKLIKGEPLPEGWTGKNWACHQLSKLASGEVIIFVDADCELAPWAVGSACALIERHDLSLLSSFPTQRLKSAGERLVVPLMDWLLLTFLPLRLVYLSRRISLTAANGQFMAFRKKAYMGIGGHSSVAGRVVEDMELARGIKRAGQRIMTVLGADTVKCRMYSGFSGAFAGFSKNFFLGFNMPYLLFFFMISFFIFLFIMPFVMTAFDPRFIASAGLVMTQRIFVSAAGRQNPVINMILHMPQMTLMAALGVYSMIKAYNGSIEWKGRKVGQ
jgi:chlorobactene glucosyltransferase